MSADFKRKFGTDNWYDWQYNNWGTKWDIDNVNVDCEDDYLLEYDFATAWSSPIAWLEKVAEQYPKLDFTIKYEEEEMGFMGKVKASGGKIISDKYID